MNANSWRTFRPSGTDVALAGAFAVAGQLVTWGRLIEQPETFVGPRPLNAVINLALMSALLWRRHAPLAAVCFAVVVYFLPHAVMPLDLPLFTGFIPFVILTASAGYYADRRRASIAAAVAAVAVVAMTMATPWMRSVSDALWNAGFLLVPWVGARGLRVREDRAATLAATLATERASTEAARREAAAGERAHIARELHDIVAHSVSMMVIQIGAARMQLQAGTRDVAGSLHEAEEAGRQTLEDLRRLLGVLRADGPVDPGSGSRPAPPQPGLAELATLIAPVRDAGLDVGVEVAGDPTVLPAALDLTAYRIVQEALTNTLRHSGATGAAVVLTYSACSLRIDVVDDGPEGATGDRSGHGLIGIGERATLFGGDVSAGPVDGGGWRVRAELPLPSTSLLTGRDEPATALPPS